MTVLDSFTKNTEPNSWLFKTINDDGHPVFLWGSDDSSLTLQTTVVNVMFGRGRLLLCKFPDVWVPTGNPEEHLGFTDGWCYDALQLSLIALEIFNPLNQTEPDFWRKHLGSQSYRLESDKNYQYQGFEQEVEARERFKRVMGREATR